MATKKFSNGGDKVGRGLPPRHTQFKKGQSGNLKGRPKGSKNVDTFLREAADSTFTATIGGENRRISHIEATALQMAIKAARGESSAPYKFLDRVHEIETRAAAKKPMEYPFGPADLEVLHAVHNRLKDYEK